MEESPQRDLQDEIRRLAAAGETPPPVSLSERFGIPLQEVREMIARSREEGSRPVRLGEYLLEAEIGSGSHGTVFRARHRKIDRVAAVKVLSPLLAADESCVRRFHREASAAASIAHPNLVSVFDVGCEDGYHFIAMEHVGGGSLAERIERRRKAGMSADLPRDVEEVARLAEGLGAAHGAGIVHRDVKPSNILVKEDGSFKLADFGLAFGKAWERLTATGYALGTPLYMSPEQLTADRDLVDERTDVYSLGLVLYEVLTGSSPYPESGMSDLLRHIAARDPVPPRELGIELDADLVAVVFKAVEKDPGRRYATAGELARDLRRYLRQEPVVARPVRVLGRCRRFCRRNRGVLRVVAATFAATLLAVLAVAGYRDYRDRWNRAAPERARLLRENEAARLTAEIGMAPTEDVIEALRKLAVEYADTAAGKEAWCAIADLRLRRGEIELAGEALVPAMLLDPLEPARHRAHLMYARLLLRTGEAVSAERWLREYLGSDPPREATARARLLLAEALLALDRPGRAILHLQEVESGGSLDSRAREEATGLKNHLERWYPAAVLKADVDRKSVLLCGSFLRPESRDLLVLPPNRRPFLVRLEGGVPVTRELPGASVLGEAVFAACGDLNLDGIDEFVMVEGGGRGCGTRRMTTVSLAGGTYSASPGPRVPEADCTIAVGDTDGDGTPDVALGMSYPERGLRCYRLAGGNRLVEMPPGDLDLVATYERAPPGDSEVGSDVRGLAVVSGRGAAPPVLMAAAADHHQFALLTFENGPDGFCCTGRHEVGVLRGLEPLGTGGRRFAFSTALPTHRLARAASADFLPPGIHVIDFRSGTRAPEIRKLESLGALRPQEAPRSQTPPEQLGAFGLSTGRGRDGDFVVFEVGHYQGYHVPSCHLRLLTVEDGRDSRLLLAGTGGPVLACDLAGGPEDQIVVVDPGSLRVYGLPGRSCEAIPDEPVPANPAFRSDGALAVGRRLEAIGHHRAAAKAYERVWRSRGSEPEGLEAANELWDVLLGLHRFRECERRVKEWAPLSGPFAGEARLVLARLWERQGEFGKAAGIYQTEAEDPLLSSADQGVAGQSAALLAPWRGAVARSIPLEGVSLSGPFQAGPGGSLEFRTEQAGGSMAVLPETWRGESFQLQFELRIEEIAAGCAILLGFGEASQDPPADWTGIWFCVGATSESLGRGGLMVKAAGEERRTASSWIDEENLAFPRRRWMVARLSYRAEIDTAELVVEDRTAEETFSYLRKERGAPRPLTECRLRVVTSRERSEPLEFRVQNLRVMKPRER